MENGRVILKDEQFHLTIQRLCHQLIENHGDFEDSCIIGVQERGVLLADQIVIELKNILKNKASIQYGKLDITFYRDDFRRRAQPLKASYTDIDFLIENKRVILIDDVLYTGRTVQAALAAIQDFGRPNQVELLTLVDRRFNRHLPIKADYTGLTIDSLDEAYVRVEWSSDKNKNRILLFSP